jgi:hypothetical protein
MTDTWKRPPGTRCGDCGAEPGSPHAWGCDVARCLVDGGQRLQCEGHPDEVRPRQVAAVAEIVQDYANGRVVGAVDAVVLAKEGTPPNPEAVAVRILDRLDEIDRDGCGHDVWTGQWPGTEDAARLGWWARWADPEKLLGWVECDADHPDAQPDIARLRPPYARWDRETARWVAVHALTPTEETL